MGNYVFTTRALCEAVTEDAQDPDSKHDMGGNIIPMLVERGEANVYDFRDNDVPGSTDRDRGYWRDVGTLDSFYEAHMDLIATLPVFNLYNHEWPIFTNYGSWPPAKFVHGYDDRQGRAVDSMISPGVVVSGALVERSVVSPNVRVNSWAHVEGSVLMEGVAGGPARGGPQRDPRQERDRPGGRADRRRPRPRPQAATRSPTTASWSIGKGQQVELCDSALRSRRVCDGDTP